MNNKNKKRIHNIDFSLRLYFRTILYMLSKRKIHPKGTIKKTKKKKEHPVATVMAHGDEGGYGSQDAHIRILHDLPPEPEPIDVWLDAHSPSPFTNEPSPLQLDEIRYNLENYRRREAERRNRSFGYPTAKEPPRGAVSWAQPINKVMYQVMRPRERTERTEFDTMPPIHRTHIVPHNKQYETSHYGLPASAAPPQYGGRKTRKKRRRKRRKTHKKRRKTKRKKRRRKKKKKSRRRRK